MDAKFIHKEPLIMTWMDITFKLGGIFLDPRHKNYERLRVYSYTFFICPMLVTFHMIHFVKNRVEFTELVELMLYMDVSAVFFLMFIWIQKNRANFIKCYQNLKRGKYTTDEFYQLAEIQIQRRIVPLAILSVLFMGGLGMYPILIAIFTNAKLGSSLTLVAPQHYPWDSSTLPGYLFTFTLQVIIGLIAVPVSFSLLYFIVLYCIVVQSHHTILNSKISQLNELAANFLYEQHNTKTTLQRVMIKKQNNIIKYHQYINSIVNDFVNAANGTMNISIFSFYSLNIFLVTFLVLLKETLLGDIKIFNMTLLLATFFTFQCYVGEYLRQLNDEVKFQLYDTDWFEQSIPYRKQMYTFSQLLQAPMHVQFMGSTDINLALLLGLVQKIYSAIQLLLKTQNRS